VKIRLRMPSPAMVVALIALFVALSGASYAVVHVSSATIMDNSIRSRDLRNNDVRGVDVRQGTITGRDVAADALTGANILESSLAKVLQAENAVRATSAGNADRATDANALGGNPPSAFASSSNFRIVNAKLALGQTATIASNGPVKLVAKCDIDATGDDRIRVLGETSTANAYLDGADDLDRDPTLLQPATLVENRELFVSTAPAGTNSFENSIDNGFVASSQGHWIGMNGEMVALGLNAFGTKCSVVGAAFVGHV
jgi:hypothetical protein